jgi:hypothetical protein
LTKRLNCGQEKHTNVLAFADYLNHLFDSSRVTNLCDSCQA